MDDIYEFHSNCFEFYKQINGVGSFNDDVKFALNQYEEVIEYIKLLVSQDEPIELRLVRNKNVLILNRVIGKSSRELFNIKMISNLDMRLLYEVLKLEFCETFSIDYKNELERLYTIFLRVYLSDNVNILFDSSLIHDLWLMYERDRINKKIDIEKIKR